MRSTPLQDRKIPVRLKLAALWTSLMFCFVYGDYFGLYEPGKLQGMLAGRMAPLGPVTQGVLLGTSAMMAAPAVMTFLSLVLGAPACRRVNIAMGALYALIMLVTMPGAWVYYLFFGAIEVLLCLAIVRAAWRWPRELAAGAG